MNIYAKLAQVQHDLKAPKTRKNSYSGYMYRNCDDILEGFKAVACDAVLILDDEIVVIGDRYYVKATATFAHPECDNVISVSAYAREIEAKFGNSGGEAMDRAQITGAASSYARKYAMNGLFALDDNQDPDELDCHASPTAKTISTKKHSTDAPTHQKDPNISDKQISRMMAIAGKNGWTSQAVDAWLFAHNWETKKNITASYYDALVAYFQYCPASEAGEDFYKFTSALFSKPENERGAFTARCKDAAIAKNDQALADMIQNFINGEKL